MDGRAGPRDGRTPSRCGPARLRWRDTVHNCGDQASEGAHRHPLSACQPTTGCDLRRCVRRAPRRAPRRVWGLGTLTPPSRGGFAPSPRCRTVHNCGDQAPDGAHRHPLSACQPTTGRDLRRCVRADVGQVGKHGGWRGDGWPARRRASNVDGEETNGHQAGGPQPGPAQPGEASSVEPVSPPESRGGREVGGVLGQPGRAAREV